MLMFVSYDYYHLNVAGWCADICLEALYKVYFRATNWSD